MLQDTMANLFQTEMTRMKVMSQPPLKEGTEGLLTPLKARKRSLLPKGSTLIKLHISICDFTKTQNCVSEFDDEDDEDNNCEEDRKRK